MDSASGSDSNEVQKGWQIGATPGKLALIGGLAVLLIVVIVFPPLGSQASSGKSAAARPTRRPPPPSVNATATANSRPPAGQPAAANEPVAVRDWQLPDPTDLSDIDPFRVPPAFRSIPEVNGVTPARETTTPTRIAQRQAIKELQATGVEMVISTPTGMVAMMGGKEIRVGDRVNGFRVVKITTAGITVVPSSTTPNKRSKP